MSEPSSISIVIPTLNEEAELGETLRRARAVPEVAEIIVSDAGSTDRTRAIASGFGARVLTGASGRGQQLRLGAEAAISDVVLLLHADTWLPPDAGHAALDCLRQPGVIAGGYWKRFRSNAPWTMRGARFKCWLLLQTRGCVFGDQGFFLRRETLECIGGVPPVPLMEELELCRRLQPLGRVALANATVTTSWRKFAQHGVGRTYLLMARVLRAYDRGESFERLRERYRG